VGQGDQGGQHPRLIGAAASAVAMIAADTR
jgi:hypothetical protein